MKKADYASWLPLRHSDAVLQLRAIDCLPPAYAADYMPHTYHNRH